MEIKHKLENNNGRFFIEENDEVLAEMTYRMSDKNTMVILHTEVSKKLANMGIGKKLVAEAVEYVRSNKIKIQPLCPFAKVILEKNADYKDVLV